jgi:hypothetical protein
MRGIRVPEFGPPPVMGDHHVRFSFQLPPALLLLAPVGRWPKAPRGCSLCVDDDGSVVVTSIDGSQAYAHDQVMQLTMTFLKSLRAITPHVITGTMSAPYCRERPEVYSISFGARVSIARTRDRPMVA